MEQLLNTTSKTDKISDNIYDIKGWTFFYVVDIKFWTYILLKSFCSKMQTSYVCELLLKSEGGLKFEQSCEVLFIYLSFCNLYQANKIKNWMD